jgi:hypothetical protein
MELAGSSRRDQSSSTSGVGEEHTPTRKTKNDAARPPHNDMGVSSSLQNVHPIATANAARETTPPIIKIFAFITVPLSLKILLLT